MILGWKTSPEKGPKKGEKTARSPKKGVEKVSSTQSGHRLNRVSGGEEGGGGGALADFCKTEIANNRHVKQADSPVLNAHKRKKAKRKLASIGKRRQRAVT